MLKKGTLRSREFYDNYDLLSMDQTMNHVIEGFFSDTSFIDNSGWNRLLLPAQLGWRQPEMDEFFRSCTLEHVQISSDILFSERNLFLMRDMID